MNSQQLTVISKPHVGWAVPTIILTIVTLSGMLCLSGCEGFRYAATDAQKENAWLHGQVCGAAANAAVDENASQRLCDLTTLAHEQSTAFVADYGLPKNPLPASRYSPLAGGELREVLSQAKADSLMKPDVFELADGVMELGIALAGLVGGAYGIRIARYLKQAREKSRALKEIVAGNELFKKFWPEQADRFKESHRKQSPETKQIVTQLKAG